MNKFIFLLPLLALTSHTQAMDFDIFSSPVSQKPTPIIYHFVTVKLGEEKDAYAKIVRELRSFSPEDIERNIKIFSTFPSLDEIDTQFRKAMKTADSALLGRKMNDVLTKSCVKTIEMDIVVLLKAASPNASSSPTHRRELFVTFVNLPGFFLGSKEGRLASEVILRRKN